MFKPDFQTGGQRTLRIILTELRRHLNECVPWMNLGNGITVLGEMAIKKVKRRSGNQFKRR